MFVHPKYTEQSIASINQEFYLQAKSYLATLDMVEKTFGISKQRQRQLINANRVPGVTKLDDRNFIYRRAEAFEFYAGYAVYNNTIVDTVNAHQETYIDPYSQSVVSIPENYTRESYYEWWYENTFTTHVKPFEKRGFMNQEEETAYMEKLIKFHEIARAYFTAILG